MRLSLLPRSLSARLISLTLVALLVSQAVSYFSFLHGRDRPVERMVSDYMAQAVLSINRSLSFVSSEKQPQVVHALSNLFATYRLHARQGRCGRVLTSSERYSAEFAERLGVSRTRVHVRVGRGLIYKKRRPDALSIALSYQRDDGQWLELRQRLPDGFGRWAHDALRNMLITALFMIIAVILATRRFTRPLRELADAAERFGRGESGDPVPEAGGDEIKRSIVEFNHMRERIERFVAERTRLVAALAHDRRTPITALRQRLEFLPDDDNTRAMTATLADMAHMSVAALAHDRRTPITALRQRLEFLPDDDNTRAMTATLADMAHMSEAALTFMREESASEATRNVDLAALIDALCEDYRAAHAQVAFEPDERITLFCRPVAIRRALRNIIDNALAYGERATLSLVDTPEAVLLYIDDDGPGIVEAQMESVFDAFVRLEASRSRETGGAGLGLGLAIARSAIRGHGGDITLANRAEGGLRVRVRLPRVRA